MNAAAPGNADRHRLAARFADGPRVAAPVSADQRLTDWFAELEPAQSAALNALLEHPFARDILRGIAEFSPYLFELARADAARLIRILSCDPEQHLANLIETTSREVLAAGSEADVMVLLRRMKAEAALMIALCDIGGVWPVMRVTAALTDIAVNSVQSALRYLFQQEVARGRMTAADPDHPEAGSGLIVLAMGKMGAGELNYSSDIDLIVFFDRAATSLAEDIEPQPFFVRVTQAMARMLQQRSGDGYVFRVDLRLRPDPASTQVAISTDAALHYYEREGRTWERAAMIKARPCAGDPKAGEALIAELAPFVWRKHLDFAALADVHDMKRQMQTYRGQSEISVEGHNVKVGRGGIREIEFFAQTQQLIAGGRHPELRARPTLEALNVLADSNWITFEARDELTTAYEFLRRVEHRLQMIADEQTHSLPEAPEDVERFAHFFGYENRETFARDLLGQLKIVQNHYGKLFEGDDPTGTAKLPDIDYGAGPEDARLIEHLAHLGFKKPIAVAGTVQQWIEGDYRALRVEATRAAFLEFIPGLIDGLAHAEEPDDAVAAFDRFLGALQRGGRLISLLSQNRDFVALVALILGAAPRLGDMLARQPQIMDGLVDPRFFGAMPDKKELSARLAATLQDASSYEDFLDRLRLFGQESLFLIGTRILSGTVSAQHASTAFADVAEGIVHTVHGLVTDQFAAQYGRIKGQETAIVAMGRLGSREMTASSDLDLILLYDFDSEAPDSDGERSLHGAQYFARFTQRLISAFTTRTNYGVLYEVDMRLRPSGRAGPVASRIDSFSDYQEREAWTWEHMALTRARVISSSPEFREKIEAIIRSVLTRPRDAASTAADVADMRRAIALEKGEDDVWDLKLAAGGLVDIDFIAQYLQLAHAAVKPEILSVSTLQVLDNAAKLGLLGQSEAEILRSAARLYHDLTQILRLCVTGKFNPETAGEDLLRVMARAGDTPDFSALEARLREIQSEVRRVFNTIVGGG
ncbi:bifunctional [glutamine synthetase] adenylyltransferase/[glutamine synthetase]-adenylyl-L-tyrosine phosphorylase [Bradyrhizobium elkanii]|uniref:bifunctional [glutamine synthetase] adenylyltransferase/[glutamine synthetase]-adenylyl-L-tyrosine phosphorylase n=1 Tax=Bradyrhizobium elkanii TaxID=29448 RepID=UPI0008420174|nr:bifunctional [glutamine synthetase] adenylyltransferase/[glutamine synthetase]-adenylyl-L-tyrosine phosphorylase [Bradyrhizobium elkanii]MBP2427849.1 glutamate-ammonia-ligase adenylyltransferase [Bradyrhizobium elkanii]MCP1971047.1 glutamate-ammonia-ligase adenylyltransferase [Bradyrhizobium elkanii]MCS4107446.1 glutamate-ammonia-ligase adenylyltransferase [Bradyrhizobium elkanii]ODM72332.1 glutamine-synthetase adenylyltransferase [Bradyrhizobium elkanii]ODM73729.1 glutamine-synthetase aden